MTKVMIWPDLYKEQGHWLPTLNMAYHLDQAGYDVAYMGIKDCEDIVAPYGYPFHKIFEKIYPLGHTYENSLEPKKQRWKPHHVLPLAQGDLDSIFTGDDKPDFLVSGYFNALETLIIHYKYQIPFATVTTYLRHPSQDPAMHALTKLVWMSNTRAKKIMTLANPNGENDDIRKFVKPLDGAVEGALPEFIVCPREFDFYVDHYEHLPNVSYVEPMVTRPIPEGAPGPEDPLDNLELPDDKKIIFGTSGSQVEDYLFQARKLFDNLIKMMSVRGMEQYHLVLAVGPRLYKEYEKKFQDESPKNVSLHVWVSQIDVMKRAEVIFTHGGLATIKESIWEKVPIVILPHGKDQMDNALRIRNTGVGVVGEVSQITPDRLRALMLKAVSSRWIEKKLQKMHDIFYRYEMWEPKVVSKISEIVPV